MKRFMLSITEDMERALERERKKRMLDSIPETVRMILSENLQGRLYRAVNRVVDEESNSQAENR
jgi:hypothetical protein